MTIFNVQSYRDIIRHQIKKNAEHRGYQTKLAKEAGVTGSYLSQVLKGKVNLNIDQAFGLCEFWGWNDLNADFFLTLVSAERTNSPRLKRKLFEQAKAIGWQASRFLSQVDMYRTGSLTLPSGEAALYWSKWYFVVIREFLFTEGRHSTESIAERMSLSLATVRSTLEKLCGMGLAKYEDDHWLPMGSGILEMDDPAIISIFHQSIRQKAIQRVSDGERKRGEMAYSWVDVLAEEDLQKLQKTVKDFLREKAKITRDSDRKNQKVVSLSLDLLIF